MFTKGLGPLKVQNVTRFVDGMVCKIETELLNYGVRKGELKVAASRPDAQTQTPARPSEETSSDRRVGIEKQGEKTWKAKNAMPHLSHAKDPPLQKDSTS